MVVAVDALGAPSTERSRGFPLSRAKGQRGWCADTFGAYALEEFYARRYAYLCWGTHGSGLVMTRTLPDDFFPALAAFGLEEAARFGTIISSVVLGRHGLTARLADRMTRLEAERKQLANAAYDAVSSGRSPNETNPAV